MINRENISSLIEAIEAIRLEKFPQIPQEIVDEIILIEFENIDNRSKGQKECLDSLENFFNLQENFFS